VCVDRRAAVNEAVADGVGRGEVRAAEDVGEAAEGVGVRPAEEVFGDQGFSVGVLEFDAAIPAIDAPGFAAREQAFFPAHCIQSDLQRRGPGVDSEDREGTAHE